MRQRILIGITFVFALAASTSLAQNSNSPTVRPRKTTTTTKPSTDSQKNTDVQEPATTQPKVRSNPAKPKVTATNNSIPPPETEAFTPLITGFPPADEKAVP